MITIHPVCFQVIIVIWKMFWSNYTLIQTESQSNKGGDNTMTYVLIIEAESSFGLQETCEELMTTIHNVDVEGEPESGVIKGTRWGVHFVPGADEGGLQATEKVTLH